MTHLSAIWESFSPLCPAISLRARIWLIFSSLSWSLEKSAVGHDAAVGWDTVQITVG